MTANSHPGTWLHIDEQWLPHLRQARLDTFDRLMQASDGQPRQLHAQRSETYMLTLGDGRVFLKRWLATRRLEIAKDLLAFRRPQPLTHKEARANRALAQLDIATPRVIAEGQRRRGPLPHQGVFVSLPLAGIPLEEFLAAAPADTAAGAMRNLAAALSRISAAGLCWPDLHLRHVHVLDDGTIGLLDLERVHRLGPFCSRHHRRNVHRLLKQLPAPLSHCRHPFATAAGVKL